MLLRTTARLGRRVAEQTHAWKRFSTPAAAPDLPPPSSLSKAQALSSSRIVLDFVRLGVSGRRLDALAAAPEAPVAEGPLDTALDAAVARSRSKGLPGQTHNRRPRYGVRGRRTHTRFTEDSQLFHVHVLTFTYTFKGPPRPDTQRQTSMRCSRFGHIISDCN